MNKKEQSVYVPRSQQLDHAKERAAADICYAAQDANIAIDDLNQKTYRRWLLKKPAHSFMPTDVCLLFGSWDSAKENAKHVADAADNN